MRTRSTLVGALVAVGALLVAGCSPTPVSQFEVAKNLQNKKDYKGAIATYDKFLSDPANANSLLLPYAMYNKAKSYVAQYDQANAMATYKKLTEQYAASDPAAWAKADMADLERNPLKAPVIVTTTVTMKQVTTTKAPVTTLKVTTTTMKAAPAKTAPVTTTTIKKVAK